MKITIHLLLIMFFLSTSPAFSQDNMFKQKKERKRLWRHWRKNRQSYNPYLEMKSKNKPSARMARGEKRELKRQNRAAKRQMRKSRRHTMRK